MQDATTPWNVPVPVRPDNYISVANGSDINGIIVDSSRLSVFGIIDDDDVGTLMFSDLQTIPFVNVPGRLGSGRSGFYRGQYYKGVGRTPLAANWTTRDYLHSSGHLAASAGINELLVSIYLRLAGESETIVHCTDLLTKPLSNELLSFRRRAYSSSTDESIPVIDHYLQAISVKGGYFARWSNFIWLLDHISPFEVGNGDTSLWRFVTLFLNALGMEHDDGGQLSPDAVSSLLEEAVKRTLRNFSTWLQLGVWWGSFTNNITLDGRFLDLEVASVTCGPFIGCTSTSSQDALNGAASALIGIESSYFVQQTIHAVQRMIMTFRVLPKGVFGAAEVDFALEWADSLERRFFLPSGIFCNLDNIRDIVTDVLSDGLRDCSSVNELGHLMEIVTVELQSPAFATLGARHGRRFQPVALPSHELVEPGRIAYLHSLVAGERPLTAVSDSRRTAIHLYHGLQRECQACRTQEELSRVWARVTETMKEIIDISDVRRNHIRDEQNV